MLNTDFKVIVVGGGPVGLIAAHVLSQAGLDFVVLERASSVYPDVGASLIIWPMTFRIFDQLGILDAVQPLLTKLQRTHVTTAKGSQYKETEFKGTEMHGYGTSAFHRADLLRVFYETLPEDAKARVLVNKKVTAIDVTDEGVTATCEDGTSYQGSMIAAADGVNSKVRDLTRELAKQDGVPEDDLNDELPYPATYKVMFGNTTRFESLAPGEAFESHGHKVSTQLFVGDQRMWFFAYQKLDKPTREKVWYNQEDTERYAEEMGDLHIAKEITLREIFAKRNNAGLTNVGEGVIRQWSWKRVVFLGDAAHKVAPNFGWGLNSGIQDVVVVSNRICDLLHASPDGIVDLAGLEKAFIAYQAERSKQMGTISNMSATIIRSATWATPIHQLLDRYIFPTFNIDRKIGQKVITPLVAGSAVLDFLEERQKSTGTVPWVNQPLRTEEKENAEPKA